jgi:hypothetical protein
MKDLQNTSFDDISLDDPEHKVLDVATAVGEEGPIEQFLMLKMRRTGLVKDLSKQKPLLQNWCLQVESRQRAYHQFKQCKDTMIKVHVLGRGLKQVVQFYHCLCLPSYN